MNMHEKTLQNIHSQLCVVGGGLSGVSAAISAARAGISVTLVQDRPVLGGNASSEVRLWALGASAHMRSNNRWARESGIIGEILLENAFRNVGGNPHFLDAIILEKVVSEPNIRLLLNTAVSDISYEKNRIISVEAFNSLNSVHYTVYADYFCDASGDGIIAAYAGEPHAVGSEKPSEYNEPYAHTAIKMGANMGHSIFFYTKDTGKPVRFVPPKWAFTDIPSRIPRYKNFDTSQFGCQFWWIEYGGNLDTIHDTETIKWELWKIIYGVWDYIKNSGDHPESLHHTIEWVGAIPGKRESRRFIGQSVLTQHDLVKQQCHPDDVSYGGWSIDIHPSDGIYAEDAPCVQLYSRGVYSIRLSNMLPRNTTNLFLAGRILSTSHVAFASVRVMATLAHSAQAIGESVRMCIEKGIPVQDILHTEHISSLQQSLLLRNQFIPHVPYNANASLMGSASISVSSVYDYSLMPAAGRYIELKQDSALLMPAPVCEALSFTFWYRTEVNSTLRLKLMTSTSRNSYIPEVEHDSVEVVLSPEQTESTATLHFNSTRQESGFIFIVFDSNSHIELALTQWLPSAIQRLEYSGFQNAPEGSGFESFPKWLPPRRPNNAPIAHSLSWIQAGDDLPFSGSNLINGYHRPYISENCWQASVADENPEIKFTWDKPVKISRIILFFDVDYEHALESVQREHYDCVMPQCIQSFTIHDSTGRLIYSNSNQYLEQDIIDFDSAVNTSEICIRISQENRIAPASLFAVYAFQETKI